MSWKISRKIVLPLIMVLILTFVFSGCATTSNNQQSTTSTTTSSDNAKNTETIKIGFSMDNLALERWQKDRDLFVKRAKELGAEVLVQSANSDPKLQYSQCKI